MLIIVLCNNITCVRGRSIDDIKNNIQNIGFTVAEQPKGVFEIYPNINFSNEISKHLTLKGSSVILELNNYGDIEKFFISNRYVKSSTLNHIFNNNKYKYFQLLNCKVEYDKDVVMSSSKKLTRMVLSGVNISDNMINEIIKIKSLKSLLLSKSSINNTQINVLRNARKDLKLEFNEDFTSSD